MLFEREGWKHKLKQGSLIFFIDIVAEFKERRSLEIFF